MELKLFQVDSSCESRELSGDETARMVRAFSAATRVRDPQKLSLRPDLIAVERRLYDRLRTPSDSEIQMGVRFAIWPLALIVTC